MFLSILVAAYWLRRCRNTWSGAGKKKATVNTFEVALGLNYALASDRVYLQQDKQKARFEASSAAATLGCQSKLLTITMDTRYTRNSIVALDEEKHNNCSAWYFKGSVKCVGVGAAEANGCVNWDGWEALVLSSAPEGDVSQAASLHKPSTTRLTLQGALWEN